MPGALLSVTPNPDPKAGAGVAFHLANVAPATPDAQLQYEYALFKLGLGVAPKGSVPMEVIDGQFRVQLTKLASEA